jgi:hypothetical protein
MRRLLLLPCLFALLAAATPSAALAQAADPAPTASTRAASPIGTNTATVHGAIDPNNQSTSYRFQYGTTTAYGLQTADDSAGSGDAPVDVQAGLADLTPDTTYHYRVIAWPDADPTAVVVGGDHSFRTIAVPSVPSVSVFDTRADGTTLDGRVDPNRSATVAHFEWGLTAAYGNQTPDVDVGKGSTAVDFSAVLNGLTPNTTYHYHVVATNAAGITRSGDRQFKTLRQPTGIALAAPVLSVHFGSVATISGQVQGVGVGGIRVALESSPFPFLAPFARVSNVVAAGPDGTFRLRTPPLQVSTHFHVVTSSTPAVASPDAAVLTQLLVGAHTQPLDRRHYRITGTVTPRVIGAKVTVQRKVGVTWKYAKRARTERIGLGRVGYDVTVGRDRKARRYRVVIAPRTAAYARTTSRSVIVPKLARKRG